ncbi:hypothetical protein B0H11DRAFT_1903394 [Mycena galericulata]|nr:hypothetical protein B0H11DRAFT_1903394 [Mycena galericulata]
MWTSLPLLPPLPVSSAPFSRIGAPGMEDGHSPSATCGYVTWPPTYPSTYFEDGARAPRPQNEPALPGPRQEFAEIQAENAAVGMPYGGTVQASNAHVILACNADTPLGDSTAS